MIRYIANHVSQRYLAGTFEEFLSWWMLQISYQLDIETNITDWWNDKILISMQFGSTSLRDEPIQWFLQWSELTAEQRDTIINTLNNDKRQKLIHNGRFEYIILRSYNIILENIYDTMLGEKVIRGGMDNAEYSLADISWKYLRIIMDKSLQMVFGDNIIDDSKLLYGCTDVMYLDIIKRQQIEEATTLKLLNVLALEMEVLPAFSDITYEGMMLDVDKWRENIALAEPIIQRTSDQINSWLRVDPFKQYAYTKEIISNEDRLNINFKSWQQKGELLKLIFPDLIGGTKPIINKYIRDNAGITDSNLLYILLSLRDGDYTPLQEELLKSHRDYLIRNDYLTPAGVSTINWNSTDQALPLMQLVEPKLKSLSEEDVNKTSHPILRDLQRYKNSLKLTSNLGESFIHKYLAPDGRIHSNFNQIISTGRCSSSNPNMQNIAVGERVTIPEDKDGLRYRNSFICEPGWQFVDGDYISQELVIIAYISRDPVWMECIDKGWDLHSVCAELVFKDKWRKAAETDCSFYKMVIGPDGKLVQNKQKCKCRGHKKLRDMIKPISFGLAYGMSEFKLAGELQITIREAKNLIEEYFSTFPKIGEVLDIMGRHGVEKGWVPTLAPFHRKRFYPVWEGFKPYIDPYLLGIINVPALGEIERASKNHPIQGTSADIVKTAMVLVRDYIKDNDLRDIIKLQANVHDQITTKTIIDYAPIWQLKLNELMCTAGKLVIPTGILKAEVNITDRWSK